MEDLDLDLSFLKGVDLDVAGSTNPTPPKFTGARLGFGFKLPDLDSDCFEMAEFGFGLD